MKTLFIILMIFISQRSLAQSAEVEQLLLNAQKLQQLQSMLSDMKSGYQTLYAGYTRLHQLASGNLGLHEVFYARLLKVNPSILAIGQSAKVLAGQVELLRLCARAVPALRSTGQFTIRELSYMAGAYGRLAREIKAEGALLVELLQPSAIALSDAERLAALQQRHSKLKSMQATYLSFHGQNQRLARQRKMENWNNAVLKNLFK